MPAEAAGTFDLVVVGAGMAGLAAARRAAAAGKGVAVVDTRPYGGTCALRGCDPKKVLLGAAELVDWQRRMQGRGIEGGSSIDWPELMAFKRSFTEPVPERLEAGLLDMGVATYHGPARFDGRQRLRVGQEELHGRAFLLAVGAEPRELTMPGAEHVVSSADFLELEELPPRIVFVGGGFVSFEFAHLAARAGSRATIVHRGERPLGAFDPDLVDRLVAASREAGIEVQLASEVTAVEALDGVMTARTADDAALEAELVVHGAGRVPELGGLDLAAAGVRYDVRAGVEVDEHLRSTSNPAVYAAGDAAASGGAPLTPVAVHEGLVAASNVLKGDRRRPDYTGTPSVVFTMPALARAGLSVADAHAQGLDVEVRQGDMSDWYTARRTGEAHAAYKVLIDRASDRVVGAHLLAGHAGETIDLFALAIRHGLTRRQLKTSVWVHPAAASDVAYMM